MKTFLVVNPHSANGQTGRRWPEVAARVKSVVGEFGHAFTRRQMDAAQLAAQALDDGYECIVAVGGDGTVNEVVNGFFDEHGQLRRPGAALGVVERGTGGDFRRTFGWDSELASAAARLQGDRCLPLDVGKVEFTASDGKPAVRYFVNVCSFGASGQVDAAVNRTTKILGGRISFALGTMRALTRYRDQRVRIRLDGGAPEELPVTVVAVANGRYFGGGMKVAPEADTRDGLFDVTVWTGYGLKDFVLKAPALYNGQHVRLPGTRTMRCRTLWAESDQDVLLDVDGEQPGRLPCRMTVVPGALSLKV